MNIDQQLGHTEENGACRAQRWTMDKAMPESCALPKGHQGEHGPAPASGWKARELTPYEIVHANYFPYPVVERHPEAREWWLHIVTDWVGPCSRGGPTTCPIGYEHIRVMTIERVLGKEGA